jgi:Na+/melibiose symporter-like transporter
MAVLAVAALSGLVRPSDIGLRTAMISATLPAAHLVAALGVSRTTQDSARIGGALAGAGFVAAFGMAFVYVVITALYLVAAAMTGRAAGLGGRTSAEAPSAARSSPWRDLVEGLAHVWRTPRLRAAMLLAALVNLCAFPLTMGLMPYIAREVLQLDQRGLGWLVASFATGALMGSLALSAWGRRLPAARVMMAGALLWYVCLSGFVMAATLPVAMTVLVLAGIAQSFSMVSMSILLLRTTEERLRGRIMGVRMLAIYTLPLGLMAAGGLIPAIGYRATGGLFVGLGIGLTLLIAWIWRRDLLDRSARGNVP